MKKHYLLFIFLFFNELLFSQCSYEITSLTHVNCFNDNTGEINISIPNSNVDWNWTLPNGNTSNAYNLSNLQSGKYIIQIKEYFVPGDTSSILICSISDTIKIEQTIDITANFVLSNMCNLYDSANVKTTIYGGTRPYQTLWAQTGDTNRNVEKLAPRLLPYTLIITDANGCTKNENLKINTVDSLITFMSKQNVICKDDNSGQARVFVENGTPPYKFEWNNGIVSSGEDFSEIYNLYPGTYSVLVSDTMGCSTIGEITIETNPKFCIKVYKVFSPNDDGIHDFWEIENIHLYPNALIEIYDRRGNIVFRRRNYINSSETAFNGYDKNGRRLPSGTYYYILNLEQEEEVYKGSLTIIR
tara:strand:+ start:384 stop:1457 length:1074 start_codon:yes stop_codon:yes gene_type:complete